MNFGEVRNKLFAPSQVGVHLHVYQSTCRGARAGNHAI